MGPTLHVGVVIGPGYAIGYLVNRVKLSKVSRYAMAGFLFESQVVHDLCVYAQPHRADVRFYRDDEGLEVDAIVEADGR